MFTLRKSYWVIFTLSFLILSLQLLLSSLFRVYLHLPFLSISFAFLGLSSAGVYAYFHSDQKKIVSPSKYISYSITLFGLANFLFFTLVFPIQQFLRSVKVNSLLENKDLLSSDLLKLYLLDIMKNSLFMGVCFSVCFFFIGLAVAYIYKHYADRAPKVYLMDLSGAALGGIAGTFLINFLKFSSIPVILSGVAFLLAFLILDKGRDSRVLRLANSILILLSVFCCFRNADTGFMDLKLDHHMTVRDYDRKGQVQEIWSGWNSYSRLGLFRYKLQNEFVYKHLFEIDQNMGLAHVVPYNPEDPFQYELFGTFTPVALSFILKQPEDILIMFAGAGKDMLEAYSYSYGQADITGVEINPMIVHQAVLLSEFKLKEFFNLDKVHMVVREGRNFLESNQKKYDSIIYSWAGASFANNLGISAYTGQYLFTQEAFLSLLDHLKEDGTIGIVNNNKVKVVGLAKSAYEARGDRDFASKIVIFDELSNIEQPKSNRQILTEIDSIKILLKNSQYTTEDVDRIKMNLRKMGYGLIYAPGYVHPNYTIFNRVIFSADTEKEMVAISRENFIDQTLATDNKPFIANAFYFESVFYKEFWESLRNNNVVTYSTHYYLNALTLLFIFIVGVIGMIMIVLPFFLQKKDFRLTKNDRYFFYYFSALGFGFMLIEIAVMNQFILFLGNPIYSFSLILAGLLISTGLGSHCSKRLFESGWLTIKKTALVTAAMLSVYTVLLPWVIHRLLGVSLMAKVCVTFMMIIPLGFCLGIFFPQGLKVLDRQNKTLIPLVWGLNGYMGILGSLLSIYFSTIFGFKFFLLFAAGLYFSLIFIPGFDRKE